MSDINFIPEAVVAEPVADVSVEVIPDLTGQTALPNAVASAANSSAATDGAAPSVEDLHHIHMGFITVSVREGVARLEALIAKLES